MRTIILWLRSLLFNIAFVITASFFIILGNIFSFLPRSIILLWARGWCYTTIYLCRFIAGITFEIKGQAYLQQARIIACRHESFWETFIFHLCIHDPVFVMKKELLRIPFLTGFLKKLNFIPIDRQAGLQSLKQMQQAIHQLDPQSTLIIFPEGSRMQPGQSTKIQSGVYMIYQASQGIVTPVMLNSGHCWDRGQFFKRPGHIIVEARPPIMPGLDKKQFMHALQQVFEKSNQDANDALKN